jgi:FixJ family two-component response regulator
MSPSSALVHVIDDDEAVRASLAFLLETAGFSCRTWDSAFAFLNSGETASSDCIVTDVRMPRTVEVYRANVMTKTGARSLSELVRMSILAGF